MRLIYANETIDVVDWNSVFLAGPTPRNSKVNSWRPEAIKIFEDLKFDGSLYIPESRTGEFAGDYDNQVEWEHLGIANAGVVLFWVPRDVDGGMPAFTTNVEFGWVVRAEYECRNPERVVYGRPDGAEKCRYLDWLYHRYLDKEPYNSLEEMIRHVVNWL